MDITVGDLVQVVGTPLAYKSPFEGKEGYVTRVGPESPHRISIQFHKDVVATIDNRYVKRVARWQVVEWVNELRYGGHNQGVGYLHHENGFKCCLGVYCATNAQRLGINVKERSWYGYDGTLIKVYTYDKMKGHLPDSIASELNITNQGIVYLPGKRNDISTEGPRFDDDDDYTYRLTELNDETKEPFTFEHIADVIEYVERYNLWVPLEDDRSITDDNEGF